MRLLYRTDPRLISVSIAQVFVVVIVIVFHFLHSLKLLRHFLFITRQISLLDGCRM